MQGNDHFSVHAPGWAERLHPEFDAHEASIVASVRRASYAINGESLPPLPTLSPPARIWFTSPSHLCWTGAAWASSYVIVVKHNGTGEERELQTADRTKEGCLAVDLSTLFYSWDKSKLSVRMRSLADGGIAGADSHEIAC